MMTLARVFGSTNAFAKMSAQCLCYGALVASLVAATACAPGTGEVTFTTWGEEYIEEGLPSDAFLDRWSVRYSKFLVAYNHVTVADDDGHVVAKLERPRVFDLAKKSKGGPKTVVVFELEAKAWPNVSYQVGPITDDAEPGDLATDEDVALLQEAGASVHVEGTATGPSGLQKHFDWDFAPATLFQNCFGEQDGKEVEGVLVTNGGRQEVELTVHGDHMFYDDLQSEAGGPRFEAYARADANDDGEVTLAELDEVPLYAIPPELGPYGTGALGNVNTLGEYVRTLSRTIGHYRGEGSCNSKEIDSR